MKLICTGTGTVDSPDRSEYRTSRGVVVTFESRPKNESRPKKKKPKEPMTYGPIKRRGKGKNKKGW